MNLASNYEDHKAYNLLLIFWKGNNAVGGEDKDFLILYLF